MQARADENFSRLARSGEDLLDDLVAADLKDSATVEFTAFDGSLGFQTADPVNIQAILATQFDDFSAGHRRYNTFEPVVGHSIFTSDGKFWTHSRALFRPQFARENINDLEMTEKASKDLIEAIGAPESNGWTTNTEMMPLLYNFTLDTATDFLFGESIESQKVAIAARKNTVMDEQARKKLATQLERAQEFSSSFRIANEYMLMRIRLQSLYFLGDSFKFRRAVRRIRRVTDRYVKLACDTAASSEKPEGKKQSLMFNLANQTQDRIELRNQTLSILLAGRDTTASLLGWALTRLALHPEVFSRLRISFSKIFRPAQKLHSHNLKDVGICNIS